MTSGNVLNVAVDSRPVSEVRQTVDRYRQVRPYFEGDYYPLYTHKAEEAVWYGYQLHLPDQQRGMIVVFRRNEARLASSCITLHGIAPETSYKLTDTDAKTPRSILGSQLRTLVVTIEEKPGSRLLFYEKE
jgi:hypothetical protein